jgi:hypothetical protein
LVEVAKTKSYLPAGVLSAGETGSTSLRLDFDVAIPDAGPTFSRTDVLALRNKIDI